MMETFHNLITHKTYNACVLWALAHVYIKFIAIKDHNFLAILLWASKLIYFLCLDDVSSSYLYDTLSSKTTEINPVFNLKPHIN